MDDHHQLVNRAYELLTRATDQWGRPDIFDLFQHLLCETRFADLENTTVLAWFPTEVLKEAIQWLEEEVREGETEMLEDMLDASNLSS
jgi:hypothetical protein